MKLISWGANQFGQLAHKGWPVFEASNTPKQCSLDGLPHDILTNISNICGGGGHTLLLDSDGCVWACGQNNRGQCGAPTDAEIKTITPWTKVDINGLKVRQIAAGWEHSAAVTDNGRLYVWGSNSHGQLGQVVERGKCTYQPHCMAENVKKVSAGLRQTTWIDAQNVINCSSSTGENKITVPGVLKPIRVASGQKHNVVLMANAENDERLGQIFCWGDNKFGQLATGLDGGKSVELVEVEAAKETEFLNIACGWSHSAGITADGRLMCWGRSNYGQLGCPEQVDKRGPFTWFHDQEQQVKVTQIALGSEHTLALTETGLVYASGWNEHGNCGNGSFTDQFSPAKILEGCKLIGCGASHCFALVSLCNMQRSISKRSKTFGSKRLLHTLNDFHPAIS